MVITFSRYANKKEMISFIEMNNLLLEKESNMQVPKWKMKPEIGPFVKNKGE